jgi:hypothetical protein
MTIADAYPCTMETIDYIGRRYSNFYVDKSPQDGPGWYVFGRYADAYGGKLIKLCGRPDIAPRAHPHYNVRVRRGWSTRARAQHWADAMNGAK